MSALDFQQNFFELFELPVQFALDTQLLGQRYRALQQELHPDRFAAAGAAEQRVAVQYSARVNEAYNALREPLPRALYLMELAGWSGEQVSAQQVDGGFLIEQMELREKLESVPSLVDPETVLEHIADEIAGDLRMHEAEFAAAFAAENLSEAASACVKMQYLVKLLVETEHLEEQL